MISEAWCAFLHSAEFLALHMCDLIPNTWEQHTGSPALVCRDSDKETAAGVSFLALTVIVPVQD